MQSDDDLAGLCASAVRQSMPGCDQRRLRLLFDYEGPSLAHGTDGAALGAAMRRVFDAAAEILQDGFVFFTGRASLRPEGGATLTVVAAATGCFHDAARQQRVLQQLQLQGAHSMTDDTLAAPVAQAIGTCPLTGGEVHFNVDPVEGALFSLTLPLPNARTLPADEVDADEARVWVVAEEAASTQGVERRLQRLGWHVRSFDGLESAAREAEHMPPGWRRPALVLAFESSQVTLERLRWLWALLPPSTEVVLAVQPQSAALQTRTRAGENVSVRPGPFSPADLQQFTRRAARAEQEPSGLTRPAPLGMASRRRALVVDDNEVNLMVASGMLQVLGYEVDTATDGVQAIDRCMQMAPDLVLMDLHMPGMDGLEATRRLRLLQREGAMPRFLIVAATADTTAQQACEQAGMDAHLPKPLSLAGLESQLQRLATSHP